MKNFGKFIIIGVFLVFLAEKENTSTIEYVVIFIGAIWMIHWIIQAIMSKDE